jgi:integrase
MRLTESAALKRTQIDLEAKTLRLLGDVEDVGDGFAGVKNHNDITLPLSTVLYDILLRRLEVKEDHSPAARRRRRRGSMRSTEYVFPSFGKKKPYISDARATMEAISEVAGCHCSPHTLRRTYEDILRYAKVDPDLRRVLLNHLAEDVHQASYANDDSDSTLRPAVEAAAQWIVEQAAIAESANVVQFRAKAS